MGADNVNVALFCKGQFKLSRASSKCNGASSKKTSGPVHFFPNLFQTLHIYIYTNEFILKVSALCKARLFYFVVYGIA